MENSLSIHPVTGASDVEAFIRFPFGLYRDYPHWVPPLLLERREFLDPAKNPVFEYAKIQLFMAFRGSEVAGTIAAICNNRYGEFHPEDRNVGFFGLFESIQDQEVAQALLQAAADWLRKEGKTVLRGPVNFTTNDIVGLLVDGFEDDPAILMPYNPAYYGSLMEGAGLTKVKDLFAFTLAERDYKGQLDGVAARLEKRGHVKIRPVELGRWTEELEFVRSCYNVAWAKNWGFVPWTDRELAFIAKELKPLIDPRLAFVAEVDGKSAGFCISVPDANQAIKLARGRLLPFGLLKLLWKLKVSKCTRLRTIAMGVLPEHRRRGIDAILVHHLVRQSVAYGCPVSEMGWILEDNEPMLSALRQIGAQKTKTYRVYDRAL
ncbi:MAG: GNAT family N-acetyltransferase [Holophagaceae bacterium]|nr:GNAT family N-acetyltransferase [Holophagaceae bacterium]